VIILFFFSPYHSYHGKDGWKENQGLSLFVYPRGYSGCSLPSLSPEFDSFSLWRFLVTGNNYRYTAYKDPPLWVDSSLPIQKIDKENINGMVDAIVSSSWANSVNDYVFV